MIKTKMGLVSTLVALFIVGLVGFSNNAPLNVKSNVDIIKRLKADREHYRNACFSKDPEIRNREGFCDVYAYTDLLLWEYGK